MVRCGSLGVQKLWSCIGYARSLGEQQVFSAPGTEAQTARRPQGSHVCEDRCPRRTPEAEPKEATVHTVRFLCRWGCANGEIRNADPESVTLLASHSVASSLEGCNFRGCASPRRNFA